MMPRFQMSDDLYDDPAVARAGTAAFGLYARCGDYVARHLLDGVVPSEVAAQYGTPEWTAKLLDVGLWETAPGGFFMPRYLAEDKNPPRHRVLADRKRKAARQQRWLEKARSAKSKQRRVSRPSTRPPAEPSGDASVDVALPPSLREGSSGGAAPNAPPARRADHRTLSEATEHAHVPLNGKPLRGDPVHTIAAQARQAIAKREQA